MVEWGLFGDSKPNKPAETDGGESISKDVQPRKALEQQLDELREERDDAVARADRLESKLASERAKRGRLQDAIEELTTVISANADGDLTASPGDPGSEAVAPLYDAYDDLLTAWRDTAERMVAFSEQVSSATAQVESRVESTKDASHEVSDAVEKISDGSDRQSARLDDISAEMRDLSATIEEIAASANEVATTASGAADHGQSAQESATEALAELDSLTDHAAETTEKLDRLDDLMTDIEDVVAFIQKVADQTNILALNANIEAARAGDTGDGFAVVASEVKSLASETKDATDEVEESIQRVRDQVATTVEEMERTSESVAQTQSAVGTAVDELDAMAEQVREVDHSIQEIDKTTDSQAASTQEVVSMVDEVGDISETTAEDAGVAASAAQKQTTALVEVSTRVATLSDRATTLERLLDDIELADNRTAAAGEETVVDFWHAMGGEKALLLEELAREFERETDGIRISLSSKGSYRGTLDATLGAAEAGSPPAIAQIFEIGSTRARDSGQFRPVEDLLSRQHVDSLLDPVTNYYRYDGRLHSLPFNASNPVLAYNRDAFERAGLDPADPPATLPAVTAAAEELVDRGGTEYGITFANYSWFVEQWFSEADELLVDGDNGRTAPPTTTNLDGDFAQSLLEWWTDVEERGLYHNPGIEARGAATTAFHDEEAAILICSTSSLGTVESDASFAVGTGQFPVLNDRTGVLVGGASLWVGDNLESDVHEAVGDFLTWLTEPEQQNRWHRETGYFPVHEDAIPQLRREDWFVENPHYETAFEQLVQTTDTTATRGAQIGPFDTVRSIIEEGVKSIDSVEDVPSNLARIDEQVSAVLSTYDG